MKTKGSKTTSVLKNRCTVTIEGVGDGILFNNPAGMQTVDSNPIGPKVYDKEKEADAKCYWDSPKKKELVCPSWNVRCSLVKAAGGGLKSPISKKVKLKPIVSGDMHLYPTMIGMGTKNYDIDSRRVNIQGQGVIRHRPWLKNWQMTFDVEWEKSSLGVDFDKNALPELLKISGERIGLCDFRPEKNGPFGKYRVLSIVRA